ncbi:substrate-binding domain-containing protein [Saccharibacillus alkalitolerans]|uniref:Sugar ABC transporter substrate-binding protein n=1 Tax=Saccharibacillus alkalitolerans TaxID=2705290 RepID=A0ABX0FEB9_9BACL|nr:substrate-binding domain-containing protein [Saccharibacillus alkalitolerans]NGZ77592.1 sugar ABC transporter substrate-binding protein [Saccharibacillus alkalitolerans]
MKKTALLYMLLIAAFLAYAARHAYVNSAGEGSFRSEELRGELGENYVMVTFLSGIEYWKSCLKGFEDAAEALNVSIEYRGATQYDAREQITVLEQIIAKKPAGIAISAIDPSSLTGVIDKAVDAGIPVVVFDSGAPGSKAYSFLGTDNYAAGATAADQMAELLGGQGKVAVITLPSQQNHDERTRGFRDTIEKRHPDIKVVAVEDDKGDAMAAKELTKSLLKRYPDLAGVFVTEAAGGKGAGEAAKELKREEKLRVIAFDTDKDTLDMIREGSISAAIAQGTWNMGYWSLQYLFHLHHDLTIPSPAASGDVSPLPVGVDTGISVVTPENVDDYYAK